MRVCVVGDFSESRLDEGLKNVAHYIAREAERYCVVNRLNLKSWASAAFWNNLREFRPDIIHYVPGSSVKGFMLLKMMKLLSSRRKIIGSPLKMRWRFPPVVATVSCREGLPPFEFERYPSSCRSRVGSVLLKQHLSFDNPASPPARRRSISG